MIPTRLPAKSTPSLGQLCVWQDRPFERVDAGNIRHRRRRENADGSDQKTRRIALAALQGDLPAVLFLVVMRGGNPAVELNIARQVELVGDIVQIPLSLRLGREVSSQSHSSSSSFENE
jgi:hypothetical protein